MAEAAQTARIRTFYTLIATQTLSAIGSRISGLAVGIWVFAQTGQATPLALVTFFATIPQILAVGFAGALADRFDRRAMLILSDAGQAVGTLLLLLSFVSGAFEIWHLYVLALWQAFFGVFQAPAFSASVTMLVPDEKRDRANAIQQLAGPTAGVIAPAIAGIVYAAVGVVGAILIDLATFVIAVVIVFLLHIPRPARTDDGARMAGSIWKEAFSGFAYLWARRPLLWLCLFIAAVNFLVAAISVLSLPYILLRVKDPALLGGLLAITSAGAIAGGLVMTVFGGAKQRIHTLMIATLALSVTQILSGMAQQPWSIAVAFFLIMSTLPFINASVTSIYQAKVAPDVQGRVFAAMAQINIVSLPVGYLISGPLADRVFEPMVGTPGWDAFAPIVGAQPGSGMGLLFVVCGTAMLLVTLAVYALPAFRRMEANVPNHSAAPA